MNVPPVAALQLSRLLETPLDEACGRRVDVAELRVGHEGMEDELDLRALVWVVSELGVVEQRVKYSEIGMSQLTKLSDLRTSSRYCRNKQDDSPPRTHAADPRAPV